MATEKSSGRNKENNREGSKERGREGSAKSAEDTREPKVSPTGDMLTAHLLAMLNGWSAYGYELAQKLEESGLGSYNKGTIYRLLRQMEESGLVSSNWDTSKDGPARRIYDMTEVGKLFLNNWMKMVQLHQNFVLDLMEMNPLMPKLRRRESENAGTSSRTERSASPESSQRKRPARKKPTRKSDTSGRPK